jgi:hypothetical protein
MSRIISRRMLLRMSLFLAVTFTLAGCGGVDWFPEYKRLPTTPDQFSFETKTGVPLSTTVTSDAITVSGLTGSSSPVSINGSFGSNSKYSINGGAPTDAAGTVKNGDKVTVSHTSASTLGSSIVSTLTIGNVSGTFTSVTATVAAPKFSAPAVVSGLVQVTATLQAVDTGPAHTISIKDSLNSTTSQFAIADSSNVFTVSFTHNPATVFALNNHILYVRNVVTSGSTAVTTTLTIDGVDYPVPLTQ